MLLVTDKYVRIDSVLSRHDHISENDIAKVI